MRCQARDRKSEEVYKQRWADLCLYQVVLDQYWLIDDKIYAFDSDGKTKLTFMLIYWSLCVIIKNYRSSECCKDSRYIERNWCYWANRVTLLWVINAHASSCRKQALNLDSERSSLLARRYKHITSQNFTSTYSQKTHTSFLFQISFLKACKAQSFTNDYAQNDLCYTTDRCIGLMHWIMDWALYCDTQQRICWKNVQYRKVSLLVACLKAFVPFKYRKTYRR